MPSFRRFSLALLVTTSISLMTVTLPARAQEPPPQDTTPPDTTPSTEQPPPDGEQPPTEEPAPEEPPPIVIPDFTPHVQLLLAQLGVAEADQLLAETGSFLGQADAVVAAATAERDGAQARMDTAVRSVKALAVQAYVDGGDNGLEDTADPLNITPGRMNTVMFSSVQGRLLQQLAAARQDLQVKQGTLDAAVSNRLAAAAAQAEAQAAADRAHDGLYAASRHSSAAISPTVMGASVLTPEEIAGWFQSQPQAQWVGTVDLLTMATLFIEEATAEGVRGDIAWAQAMVETGAFSSRLAGLNNFAGIGACDSCADGWHFESAQQGVRVQMQLLHAYAEPATLGFGNALIVTRFNDLGVKGCCRTWSELTGIWATDPNYGLKIMQIYDSMLGWTAAARGLA